MNGTTKERTSIRATPGGDVLGSIDANIKITFITDLGSWLKLSSVDGIGRAGYVNSRSVTIDPVVVVPPPPPVVPVYAMEIKIHSDTALVVTTPDGVAHNYTGGDVVVSAENPTMKLA